MKTLAEEIYDVESMEKFKSGETADSLTIAYYTIFLYEHRDKLWDTMDEFADTEKYGGSFEGDADLLIDIYNCGVEVWAETWTDREVGLADVVYEIDFVEDAIRRFYKKIHDASREGLIEKIRSVMAEFYERLDAEFDEEVYYCTDHLEGFDTKQLRNELTFQEDRLEKLKKFKVKEIRLRG